MDLVQRLRIGCQIATNGVSIDNYFPDLLPVVSGVLQGSIIGPILFLVYIFNYMSS